MTKNYPYKNKTFSLSEPQEYAVTVSRDNYSVVVSVKDAKGYYKLICPDTHKELGLVDNAEKAFDNACSIILEKMKIAEYESEAFRRLSMAYHSQWP